MHPVISSLPFGSRISHNRQTTIDRANVPTLDLFKSSVQFDRMINQTHLISATSVENTAECSQDSMKFCPARFKLRRMSRTSCSLFEYDLTIFDITPLLVSAIPRGTKPVSINDSLRLQKLAYSIASFLGSLRVLP